MSSPLEQAAVGETITVNDTEPVALKSISDSVQSLKSDANDVSGLIKRLQVGSIQDVGCAYLVDNRETVALKSISDSVESLKSDANDVPQHIKRLLVGSLQVGCAYLIDNREAVAYLVDSLLDLPASPPSIYIDIEGVNLCRFGTISILQILVLPHDKIYLVDVHVLKGDAFTTAGETGQSLKGVLESVNIPKVFFDVRNDSDALFSHFGVSLACVQDTQLMELATRTYSRKYISGLSKCIQNDLPMTASEKQQWIEGKDRGKSLFSPKLGGSYEVFNVRPLADEIALYCTQDVRLMPKLWEHYFNKLPHAWAKKVEIATKDRIALSQTAGYNGNGPNMALGPW